MDARLSPPFWRHDAYTLRQLRASLESRIQEHVLPDKAVVVDVGAGAAPYRTLFTAFGAQYKTCDIDSSQGAEIVFTPGTEIPVPSGTADRVVSFQVLEHVWDLDWYLGECRRLLKPDGLLMLSTHGTWLYHPHPTDFRRWTRDGLTAELEQRGFRIVSVTGSVGPLAWTTQFRALALNHVLRRMPLVGGPMAALLCSIMHLRMIVEDAITPRNLQETNAAVYLVVAAPTSKSN